MQNWYRRIVPLDRSQHKNLALTPEPQFRFAASDASLALSFEEFGLASGYFPIVFSNGPVPMPMALCGVRQGTNVFVGATGAWAPDAYIPAVVRNYPFVVLDTGDGRELVGIDAESDLFLPVGGQPLFDGDEPSELLKQRMGLCNGFRDSMKRTTEFAQALAEAKLLDDQEAAITLPGGETVRMNGFSIVNQARFEQIADKLFLEWRRRGFIGPIYQHLASQTQWRRLMELAVQSAQLAA